MIHMIEIDLMYIFSVLCPILCGPGYDIKLSFLPFLSNLPPHHSSLLSHTFSPPVSVGVYGYNWPPLPPRFCDRRHFVTNNI